MRSLPMKPFHTVIVRDVSEREKADFLNAGVGFTLMRGSRGESIKFDISEEDPLWMRVEALIASLEGTDQVPKKDRVQDISMTEATMEELLRRMEERAAEFRKRAAELRKSLPGPPWLDGYSGQSTEDLLSLEGKYRIDSLVLAFEEAITKKAERTGKNSLTNEERIVMAIEALEREVNNGGYHQFFTNSSKEFAPIVADALLRIGCKKAAQITKRAIKAIGVSALTEETLDSALATEDELLQAKLSRCDDAYNKNREPIANQLFAFIKANKASISL